MSAMTKILTGAAGVAAFVGMAAPASAQYYPQPNPYGYGNGYQQNQGVLGAIVNGVLGYGRYPYGNYGYNTYGNQSQAIDQCARTIEARLNGYNGYYGYGQGYGGYNNNRYGNQYGYNQGYNNGGRVQGITRVERKNYGLKVYGVASSGYRGYEGYNRRGYGTYGYSAGADLRFNCEVTYNGRIRDIDIKRREANWRGY